MWVKFRRWTLFPLILAAAFIANAATLSISPQFISDCSNGLGKATLIWDDAGTAPVQVRVGSRDGPPLTGPEASSGSAVTGYWITEGMVFVLVNDSGIELARVAARLNCGGSPNPIESAFTQGSYFPLQVGNRWTYRVNSRSVTSAYTIWTLVRTELVGERTYYVMNLGTSEPGAEIRLRSDADGRVYRLTGQAEQLWLDPTAQPEPALLRIGRRGPFTGSLGTFPDAVYYENLPGLSRETGTFVRGLGLTANNITLLTGSSGGFVSGMDLVEARIGGALRLSTAATSLQVSSEATRLDVTGRRVTNCAVPCYFAACGLVPGADPPNTYKPCFQARVVVRHADANEVELELLDPAGRPFHRAVRALAGAFAAGETEASLFFQVPLYSAPNVRVPPGIYRLLATLRRPPGEAAGSATLTIRID